MSEEKQQNKKEVIDYYRTKRSLEFVRQYNQEESWQKLSAALRYKQMKRIMIYFSSSAAIISIFLASFYFFFHLGEAKKEVQALHHAEPMEANQKQGVVLFLADGGQVNLSAETCLSRGNAKNDVNNRRLTYEQAAETQDTLKWNTLVVPRGMDYQLVLSDGSRVWLNARSRLIYPEVFGELREVKLEGEAYFEVAHDEQRPFVVRSSRVAVRVLGTEFNVNTYNSERVQAVLVRGRVEVENAEGDKVILKPGELAETVGSQIQLSQVNVRKYIAWKGGEFYFENASLEEIMQEFSEWYNIQPVFTTPALRTRKFSGVLKRDRAIGEVLKRIERTTSVHFEIQEGIVNVK